MLNINKWIDLFCEFPLASASRILEFWSETRCHPDDWEGVDVACSLYLEHIFSEGFPKSFGSDGSAALQHFLPEVAGKLTQLASCLSPSIKGSLSAGFAK